jgi:TetR/AcrR family transcriptional regulator, lmrAB and yxaGH operons repressor
MSAKPKHRDPIIKSALVLFRQKGYSSTGLNDIVGASGAPKGSVYHYFPEGKVSIAVAAVERAGEVAAQTLRDLDESTPNTGEMLKAYARLLSGWMLKSGFRDGCPITTVLLELCPQERTVSKAGRDAYGLRLRIFADKLIADGYRAERAEKLAILCISSIQGALIQSRIDRSDKPILLVADELAELLAIPDA